MIAKTKLSDLLNNKFPDATFGWIGSDIVGERQRIVIDYDKVDEEILRSYVSSIAPGVEVYYFSKEDKKEYVHP